MADWELRREVLATARRAAGLSQRALAQAIGVADEDRIRLWERGEARPQARLIPLLARELHVEPLTLIADPTVAPGLIQLRVAAGLSLQDMASQAGLPVSSYHRLEKRGVPQGGLAQDTARAIAAVLRVPVSKVGALVPPHR